MPPEWYSDTGGQRAGEPPPDRPLPAVQPAIAWDWGGRGLLLAVIKKYQKEFDNIRDHDPLK